MDTRTALKVNTVLHLRNIDGGDVRYTIHGEVGRGASCIVYDASYKNNSGISRIVRIKECYPFSLSLYRVGEKLCCISEEERAGFERQKRRFREGFDIGNELSAVCGLTNSVVNTLDIYETNNTFYTVTTYMEGRALSLEDERSLRENITIVKKAAQIIQKLHDRGWLYLDLKPENIFLAGEKEGLLQLFDFDSLVPLPKTDGTGEYAVSYTAGYSPAEQQSGEHRRIGKHTDVYSVGALLFALVFGRTPDAFDCDSLAEYDFSESRYEESAYPDTLFRRMGDFFHHTLANYPADRYPGLGQAVSELELMEREADTSVPFLYGSYMHDTVCMVGRTAELVELEQWLSQGERRCFFLTGMGGIGKSTLIRQCLMQQSGRFDTILYTYFSTSLRELIVDDGQISVNTVERAVEETAEDYFRRKLKILRRITSKSLVILVVDDFDGELDEDFLALLELPWKVVIVTRNEGLSRGYDGLVVRPLSGRDEQYQIFRNFLNREIDQDEYGLLDRIIEAVAGHTLALELIAKQIACGGLALEAAAELVERNGFSGLASEKVDYTKDRRSSYQTASQIIAALIDREKLSTENQVILKSLSLIRAPGIAPGQFQALLGLKNRDTVCELSRIGLLREESMLSLHPVIREIVAAWDWTEMYVKAASHMMTKICEGICEEGERQEYPHRLHRLMEGEEHTRLQHELSGNQENLHRLIGEAENSDKWSGIQGRAEGSGRPDRQRLRDKMRLAENILDEAGRTELLRNIGAYRELLYIMVYGMPWDRDEYVFRHADEILAHPEGCNPLALMDICTNTAFCHENAGDYGHALRYIQRAKKLAAKASRYHNYLMGCYYGMMADYYESRLICGAETDETGSEGESAAERAAGELGKDRHRRGAGNEHRSMMSARGRAVRYMKKSALPEARMKLIEFYDSWALFLIWDTPQRRRTIRRLLEAAGELLSEYTGPYSPLWNDYYMACARYHTFVIPDLENMTDCIGRLAEIADWTYDSDLDRITNFLVPVSDLWRAWEDYERSAEYLRMGIRMCEEHEDMAVYQRKKEELCDYLGRLSLDFDFNT